MNLEQVWEELEASANASGGGLHARLLTPQHPLDIEAAVEGRYGQKLLMFRFPRTVLRPEIEVPDSAGINVRRVVFDRDGADNITLQLLLTDSRYTTIFTRVAEDLVAHIGSIQDPTQALQSLVGRLAEWYRFMRRQSPTVMSVERRRGLFGELNFLIRFAIANLGPEAAVAGWVGAGRSLHDFEFSDLTVEVKTTVAGGPTEFQVANERQLDDVGLAYLVIYHPLLAEIRGSGISLPDLIDEIKAKIGTTEKTRHDFEEKLADYGYFEIHRKEYAEPRYIERSHAFYRIREGFPRIVEADLDTGIGSVSYSVSTAACTAFEVAEKEITSRLGVKRV